MLRTIWAVLVAVVVTIPAASAVLLIAFVKSNAAIIDSIIRLWARILIGVVVEAAFLSYVIVAGRRAMAAGLTADISEAPDVVPVTG